MNDLRQLALAQALLALMDLGFGGDEQGLSLDDERFHLTLDARGTFHLLCLSDADYDWGLLEAALLAQPSRFTPPLLSKAGLCFSIRLDLRDCWA